MPRAFLASRDARSDEQNSLIREILSSPIRICIERVAAVDNDVALFEMRRQTIDHLVDRIAGRVDGYGVADRALEFTVKHVDVVGASPNRDQRVRIGILGVVVFLLIRAFRGRRTVCFTNILECREEGLALGKSDDELNLVPWEDVLYCRFLEQTLSQQGKTTSTSVELELNLRNVVPIIVESSHQKTPQQIHDLITPSYEAVNEAWHRMSKTGEDARTAAMAIGLQ